MALALIASVLVLSAILNSVRADEGSVVPERAFAPPCIEPTVTSDLSDGHLSAMAIDTDAELASNNSPDPAMGAWGGFVLVTFLLVSILITMFAVVVGFAYGVWSERRTQRRCEPDQVSEETDLAAEIPCSRDAQGQTGIRPGLNATTCQRHWGLGLASVTGPVRRENQDHAVAWDQGPFRIAVVADGLGGLPRGKEASTTVARSMARHLAARIGDGSILDHPLKVISEGFDVAAGALKIRTGVTANSSGLRTTLIAVVVTPQTYYWGYIGDGGFWVYRQDGTIDNVLTGHKDPDAPNVLFASIGPVVQGYPEIGSTARLPGDVIFVGSDGVFDRIPDPVEFSVSVVDAARDHFDGDLQRTVDEVVQQLSEANDPDGHPICDDNLTLVVAAPDNVVPPIRVTVFEREEPAHA